MCVCSATSEPPQSSRRHVLSFKDSSALLNIYEVPIFVARNRVSKRCLMSELCFYRFAHIVMVMLGYIFSAFSTDGVLTI